MRRFGVVVLVVALVALIAMVAPAAVAVDATSVPTIPCESPSSSEIVPSQALARYDLQPLRDAGFSGQGVRVALVELGTAGHRPRHRAVSRCPTPR